MDYTCYIQVLYSYILYTQLHTLHTYTKIILYIGKIHAIYRYILRSYIMYIHAIYIMQHAIPTSISCIAHTKPLHRLSHPNALICANNKRPCKSTKL